MPKHPVVQWRLVKVQYQGVEVAAVLYTSPSAVASWKHLDIQVGIITQTWLQEVLDMLPIVVLGELPKVSF
jgi:hypothetical protein